MIVELVETDGCFQGASIKQVGKYKFVNLANRMLQQYSQQEPCVENFPCVIRGTDSWIRFGPKVKLVVPPWSEEHDNLVL